MTYSVAESLVRGEINDPFSVLGARPHEIDGKPCVLFRAYLPGAKKVEVLLSTGPLALREEIIEVLEEVEPPAAVTPPIDPDQKAPAQAPSPEPPPPAKKLIGSGLYTGVYYGDHEYNPYRLRVEFNTGTCSEFWDAYSFQPVLGETDLFLWNQGNHYRIYEKLGAHPLTHEGVKGVVFAVWAPSARKVSVVGDRNYWDGRRLQMRPRGSSGVWELFAPHFANLDLYKYEITTQEGVVLMKSDPVGFWMEKRPKTASVVYDLDRYHWGDQVWIEERPRKNLLTSPLSVYEIHLGSWRRRSDGTFKNYRETAEELIPYLKEMRFNWVELMPVAEHPFDASWGYQVSGYYAITSRFGEPDDFRYLVDRLHQEGIGVILDWVPAHFPRDSFALEYFDGTHLYEHADPRQGSHRDWGTLVFNYGRNEVKNFLVANALFWVDQYHIDGLRVDAVASMLYLDYSRKEGEWIPNQYGGRENLEALEFIKTLNTKLYELFPGAMTIAEESTAFPGISRPVHLGGMGFLFKWNMGWMHDMLEFMSKDPIYRRYNTERLTFALLYAFHENFILPLSHDEVVYGKRSLWDKMPGDYSQKCANLRLLLGYMFGEPGKKLLFMGGEFGQMYEWNHNASLDWGLLENPHHEKIRLFMRDLNKMYLQEPALFELDYDWRGFEWIDFRDSDSTVVSFIRRGKDPNNVIFFAFNFTPVQRSNYRLGVPFPGFWTEILNSDSEIYGGSNVGMGGGVEAEAIEAHGRPWSVNLTLPPLGFIVLKRR
ncbi:MAG: 1,4-alpha-glucan branching protein GlgB [Deltaproteobacteria bacterium]|jgi:1,4-alpha-glucan branching enzyme|nr:1,4-alpha-glucan branching protein GlgB [Deltaproteobacteria bacterium]